ncbi:MAG TPA: hypothetical protein VHR45_18785 [Thermoanaerobaculia bacterium]|nr:hypothetical protein [Thermoanaerobaculia bacterium]
MRDQEPYRLGGYQGRGGGPPIATALVLVLGDERPPGRGLFPMRRWRWPARGRMPVLAGVAALLCGACNPSRESCRHLMPAAVVAPAAVALTPAATRGCRAEQDGVAVQVEAVRRNLRWERGRIWVDGVETPEAAVASTVAAVQARRAGAALGAKAEQERRRLRELAPGLRLRRPPGGPPAGSPPPPSPQ